MYGRIRIVISLLLGRKRGGNPETYKLFSLLMKNINIVRNEMRLLLTNNDINVTPPPSRPAPIPHFRESSFGRVFLFM